MRFRNTIVLVAALVVSLTACSTPSAPVSQSAERSSPTASPKPTTPKVAIIEISSTELTLASSSGTVVDTHKYSEVAAPVLSQLTASFGAAPTETPYDGGLDGPSGTDYTWDGFTLEKFDVDGTPNQILFRVIARSASSDGVAVSALGLTIGSSIASLKAAGGTLSATYNGANGPSHDGDMYRFGSVSEAGTTVSVIYTQESLNVGQILAPQDDNGA